MSMTDSSGDGWSGSSSSSSSLFWVALVSMFVMCPLTVLPLQFVAAPYGKHLRSGWGVTVPSPLAWFLMESPSLCLPIIILFHHHHSPLHHHHLLTISLFLIHYTHRTIIYPLRLLLLLMTMTNNKKEEEEGRIISKGVPLSIVFMAFCFNLHNAYLQTQSSIINTTTTSTSGGTTGLWIWWWFRIALGMGIFFWGMSVNITSDLALLRLKKEGGGYKIPRGGWFDHVCSPNYMGEVVEWLGYAVVAWSPAALAFFLYTCSNLMPRARANLRWYRDKFGEDYPTSTKAIIPFLF